MELSVRIQDRPEPEIEGNRFVAKQLHVDEIHYVIVLADGVPVAQQGFYHRGSRWWVDDLFIAKAHRGTEVTYVLREATYRAVAERADEFYAFIEHKVATPEKILGCPIKKALGVKIEEQHRMRVASKYRYDVSALRYRETGT